MKKILVFLYSVVLTTTPMFATESCFIASENNVVFVSEGDCSTRYSPCSSFKIVLAVMGYDAGIFKDETYPEWPFKEEYEAFLESWKSSQTPTTWMKNSCVWYSQVLTPLLGMEQFRDYLKKFNYGNQDVSGDIGKNNGLTDSWLCSSLEISPEEQLIFLENLLGNKLPVSTHAHNMTKNIVYIEDLKNDWKLYGKTGSGFLLNTDRTKRLEIQQGWFIGWIEKDNERIIFVNHIVDNQIEEMRSGYRAKEQTKKKLLKIIDERELNLLVR